MICFITPPSPFLLDSRVFMSLGVLKVAAVLERAGQKVEHMDLSGVKNYIEVIESYAGEATTFGITATSPQMPAAWEIGNALRKRGLKTILGGPHVTLVAAARRTGSLRAEGAWHKLTDCFDVLVTGDGEKAIFEALMTERGWVDADSPKLIHWNTSKDFDESPWPARHLVDVGSYQYYIDGERSLSMINQLGCPYKCTFSVTGDSKIYTERGWESIETISKSITGRVVKCAHGGSLVELNYARNVATLNGFSMSPNLYIEGMRQASKVTLRNGLELTGTPEHKVAIARDEQIEWVPISKLTVGDWVAVKAPTNIEREYVALLPSKKLHVIPPGGFHPKVNHKAPSVMDEDLGWLAGFLVGDGCLVHDGRRIHVCVKRGLGPKLTRIFKEKFDADLSILPHSMTTKMENGWIYSVKAWDFFVESVGIDPKDKLKVPTTILRSPLPVISAFVQGMFDSDGYKTLEDDGYVTTISKRLATELGLLLLEMGCLPNIQEVIATGYGSGVCYRVGQMTPRIPMSRAVYKSAKSGLWYWRTQRGPKRNGIRKRTLEESKLEHPLLQPGLFFVQVKSIENAGLQLVYDLVVPDGENFVANGIVSHNCAGRDSPMLRQIRVRTSDNVVAELVHLYQAYGIKGCMFLDDELNVNRKMVELMQGIRAAGDTLGIEWRLRGFLKSELFTEEQAEAMYAAGFRQLLIGFESGHPRILENIQKNATVEDNTRCMEIASKHGLKVKALMSIGHAGESKETVLAVRDWLLEVKPSDFDVTIITPYPGSPYYDKSLPNADGTWTYAAKSGDRLHMDDVDFTAEAQFYKGIPGSYVSHVWTDHIGPEGLIALRDKVEREVREQLGIPFYQTGAVIQYESSMGMTPAILRSSV